MLVLQASVLSGFGQHMLPQMLPWFRLTGSLVAAILVLQIRDFVASLFPSDEQSNCIEINVRNLRCSYTFSVNILMPYINYSYFIIESVFFVVPRAIYHIQPLNTN